MYYIGSMKKEINKKLNHFIIYVIYLYEIILPGNITGKYVILCFECFDSRV